MMEMKIVMVSQPANTQTVPLSFLTTKSSVATCKLNVE